MRVGMVVYDMQPYGGLEEYAVELAGALQRAGHPVCVLSPEWIDPDNQYLRRLRRSGVPVIQPPRLLSRLASDWETKERVVAALVMLLSPAVLLFALALCARRRRGWNGCLRSAHRWLRGRVGLLVHPDRRPSLGRLLLRWSQWRWRPEVLHLQGYTTNLLFAVEWAHARGVPIVYEEHQTPDPAFPWWADFPRTINKAEVVVAVSETSARALRTVCGVSRPIVVRSPLLADPHEAGWRPGTRAGPGAFTVTTVARLDVTKGLSDLIEAIPLVREAHPAARFLVHGDGPLREALLRQARARGLDGEAIFAGAFGDRRELAAIMARTDLFVLPSVLEGQPLAVVEAMACGRPIVATAVGGVPELIADGVNGLLCPPRDPAGLAGRIARLIADAGLREALGRAARASYERGPYQPAALARHFAVIYEQARRFEADGDAARADGLRFFGEPAAGPQ